VPETPAWKQELLNGYRTFRASNFRRQKSLYEDLGRSGQAPEVMLIACADSRVEPGDIFNSIPGEMFVVRNVANLVPPKDETSGYHGTSAALEFAVESLQVKAIVVMGHESCGGIAACLDEAGYKPGGYIDKWISILSDTRDSVVESTPPQHRQSELEFEGIRESLRNLMNFDCVRSRVEAGSLELMGAYFSVIRGVLMFADGPNGEFREIPVQA
jgi:carbonic anhydrase